jgi:hypothetical protein
MANFSLLAKLGLDSKSFQNGLKTAQKKAQGFSKHIGKLFAFTAALGGLTALIKKSVEFGSAQSDVAAQLKISTEAFQVFAGAMKDAGGSQKGLEKAILAMQTAVVQGSEGLTTFKRAFDRIGVSIDDLIGMKPEEQFIHIAKAITQSQNELGDLTAVAEIFGKKNAPFLIEVLERLGTDGFAALSKEIEETYGIMDEETQATLDDVADRLEAFGNKATIVIGKFFADTLAVFGMLKGAYEIAITPFRELLANVIVVLTEVVRVSKTSFTALFAVFLKGKNAIIKTVSGLGSGVKKAMKGDFQGALDDITGGAKDFGKDLSRTFDALKKDVGQSTQTLVDSLGMSWKNGKNEIEEEIEGIKKAYDDLTGETARNKLKLRKELKARIDQLGGDGDGDGDGDGTGGTGGTGAKEDKFAKARSVAREAFKASGGDLAKLGTSILQEKGKSDSRIEQFRTVGGEERFRRFDGGRVSGEFTREQIAAAIGKSAQEEVGGEGAIENILESIKTTLEGKFKNE